MARAHWVRRDLLLWKAARRPGYTYALLHDPQGSIRIEKGKVCGGQAIPLTHIPGLPPKEVTASFPHLASLPCFRLPPDYVELVPRLLKEQIVLAAWNARHRLLSASAVQIPGVLDDLFRYEGKLGIFFEAGRPVLRLWAPTARSVRLHLFADSRPETHSISFEMETDSTSGVWSIAGAADWIGKFYLYEVEVYAPSVRSVVRNLVTDPYSVSLAMNSTRSQVIDLNDPALMPEGWKALQKPFLPAPEDSVIYELHVRDFSAYDPGVPENERGTFNAFTSLESNGMRHLRSLANAGLTHIHLLPVFDIATINEDHSQWKGPDLTELSALPPNSSRQQELVMQTCDEDGYNWGYDPYHYNTPEGSYSTQPDGPRRILEFRQMVQALNQVGLRVVMDVVYNHTHACGQDEHSVLCKIVPGYYHRLNASGAVETSTCCPNTATEHAMMEKLMIDSLLLWARDYKVDGFRFDLMGHHLLANMVKARAALDALTLEQDGVDGKQILLYGEGWDFGEVAHNARGVNASQVNLGGTGIGSFNDRLRDAARGGKPFSGWQEQGFVTGLAERSDEEQESAEERLQRLLQYQDWIRLGLAGNLKAYALVDWQGKSVTGGEIDYNGSPTGYTLDPQENVLYVSAHDNETLFDAIQVKAPLDASLAERVRMHNLGISLVMLGQGVPFFQAGDDLLRSKSLDRNSFNSGDWFNRLDFSGEMNNFGIGLPPAADNAAYWPEMVRLLANPALKPGKAEMRQAAEHFCEMLRIRRSSLLFRLRNAEQVRARLSFGANLPGVIVMRLRDLPQERLDQNYAQIQVVFNARSQAVEIEAEAGEHPCLPFRLHPLQAQSYDPVERIARYDLERGIFSVPGRTTAVFVRSWE